MKPRLAQRIFAIRCPAPPDPGHRVLFEDLLTWPRLEALTGQVASGSHYYSRRVAPQLTGGTFTGGMDAPLGSDQSWQVAVRDSSVIAPFKEGEAVVLLHAHHRGPSSVWSVEVRADRVGVVGGGELTWVTTGVAGAGRSRTRA